MLISVRGLFHVYGDDDLDAQTDAIMDALLAIEELSEGQVSDSDVTASLTEWRVEISIVVEAESIDQAQAIGATVIQQAIKTAGGEPTNQANPVVDPATSEFVLEKRAAELIPA